MSRFASTILDDDGAVPRNAAAPFVGQKDLRAVSAMLGPGAWSIDARLFGRKYFDFKPKSGG